MVFVVVVFGFLAVSDAGMIASVVGVAIVSSVFASGVLDVAFEWRIRRFDSFVCCDVFVSRVSCLWSCLFEGCFVDVWFVCSVFVFMFSVVCDCLCVCFV